MTSLAIVIPVKNDAGRLARCLDSIVKSRTGVATTTIIVADNGSTDDSPAVAAAAGATVLALPGLRVSEMRNAAAGTADGALLAFVDADHEVAPMWIGAAIDALTPPGVGAAGALYSAPENGTWVQRMYGLLRGRTIGTSEVGWLGSGNLVVRREAFQQIGGFDASLEACEDVDFCQRLRAAGWTIVGDERLKSIHLGDPPTLRALFRAERWRGRDNFRVSLRGPLTARDIPSLVTPIIVLASLGLLAISPVLAVLGGPGLWMAGGAAIAILGMASLKALRMAARSRALNIFFLAQAMAVALTYDLARAIALITRAPHHRR